MSTVDYELFVKLFREQYPSLAFAYCVRDLKEVLERLGIDVRYSNLSGKAYSYLHSNHGRAEIVVDGHDPLPVQRFAMAHEFGHLLMHYDWEPFKRLPDNAAEIFYKTRKDWSTTMEYAVNGSIKDKQATSFATAFLLPITKVEKVIELGTDQNFQLEMVQFLARYYLVPLDIAKKRYDEVMSQVIIN